MSRFACIRDWRLQQRKRNYNNLGQIRKPTWPMAERQWALGVLFSPLWKLLCFHLSKEKKKFALPYPSACFVGFFNSCYATLLIKERCMKWSPLLVKIMRVEPPPQVILQWRLQKRAQALHLRLLKEKSLATLEREKQPGGMYRSVLFCQIISCRQTWVAMLILQLGSFSMKAAYQVRVSLAIFSKITSKRVLQGKRA